jgi:hypothetical protein
MDVPLQLSGWHQRFQGRPAPKLNPALFALLGRVLEVEWPGWYRALVLKLLEKPCPVFWEQGTMLPGGFLYGTPWIVVERTSDYRDGRNQMFDAQSFGKGKPVESVQWPSSYVIVGEHGGGTVLVDTASEEWVFFEIANDGLYLRRFIEVSSLSPSPEAFARMLIENHRQWDEDRLRR